MTTTADTINIMNTHQPPICTVDVVLLTLRNETLHVALTKRTKAPHPDALALPGGYIHTQDDTDTHAAAQRVLNTKTNAASPYLEQLATFSGPDRDPRGWSISVAYYALLPERELDDSELALVPVADLPQLPFDHATIISAAIARVRNKSTYSSLPVYLCGETFTLPELQRVYETLIGEPINKVTFRRKIAELDILEPTNAKTSGGAHRPARKYQLKPTAKATLSTTNRALAN